MSGGKWGSAWCSYKSEVFTRHPEMSCFDFEPLVFASLMSHALSGFLFLGGGHSRLFLSPMVTRVVRHYVVSVPITLRAPYTSVERGVEWYRDILVLMVVGEFTTMSLFVCLISSQAWSNFYRERF